MDIIACEIFGIDPKTIPLLKLCNMAKIGETDIKKIMVYSETGLNNLINKYKIHNAILPKTHLVELMTMMQMMAVQRMQQQGQRPMSIPMPPQQ